MALITRHTDKDEPPKAAPSPTADNPYPQIKAGEMPPDPPMSAAGEGWDAADENNKEPYPPAKSKAAEDITYDGTKRSAADKPVEYRWPIPAPPEGYQGEPLLPPIPEPTNAPGDYSANPVRPASRAPDPVVREPAKPASRT